MPIPSLLLLAALWPQTDEELQPPPVPATSALLERAGDCRTSRYQGLFLGRDSAKSWKGWLAQLKKEDRQLYQTCLQSFQGSLWAEGPESGLHYSALRRRFEWFLAPAAMAFGSRDQGGYPAWKSFLCRVLLEKAWILEQAGEAPEPQTLAVLTGNLHWVAEPERDPVWQAAEGLPKAWFERMEDLDRQLWADRKKQKLGCLPRRRQDRKQDRLIDFEVGLPVPQGRQVLVGDPASLARARRVLLAARSDPEGRRWLDPHVAVVFVEAGDLTRARWYFLRSDFRLVEGQILDLENPLVALQDVGRGPAVALPSNPALSKTHLAANLIGMGVYWSVAQDRKATFNQEEISRRMQQESDAFLKRHPQADPEG